MITIKLEHLVEDWASTIRRCKISNGVFIEEETLTGEDKNLYMLCPRTGRECTERCAMISKSSIRIDVSHLKPEFKHLYVETEEDDDYEYVPYPYRIEGVTILQLCRAMILITDDVEMQMPIL